MEPRRILLVRLDGLGDFLLSLGAFAHIRASFPEASLELLVDPGNAELAARTGFFDFVHPFSYFPDHPGKSPKGAHEFQSMIEPLGLGDFDIVVDMRHYGSTRRLVAAIPARFRFGFRARKKDADYDVLLPGFNRLPIGQRLHMTSRNMMLASTITQTFNRKPVQSFHSEDWLNAQWSGSGGRTVRKILINPFSGRAIKNWPVENYGALIEALQERFETEVSFFGRTSDTDDQCRTELATLAGVTDLGTQLPIGDLIDRLTQTDLYIGNDSGTTHLAAMLGTPTLALMSGDVEAEVWRPVGKRVKILKGDVGCAPCFLNALENCPVDHRCMTAIGTETVLEEAGMLLEEHQASMPNLVPEDGIPYHAARREVSA
ncbi:MAG: glycosyltransferase family 9 protein [Novosphingobium sp.]|nr:glycosyltransferase family 9 protein [Novosphingobium sp.]